MLHTFFSVFIVDFEQINVSWATLFLQKLEKNLCEPNIHELTSSSFSLSYFQRVNDST